MKKFILFLCIVILFFEIIGHISTNDPVAKTTTSEVFAKSPIDGDGDFPFSTSASFGLIGGGLLILAELGRKISKK